MRNKDLCINFVKGNIKGKVKSMFIEGNIIYSYGYHYPLCIRLNDGTFILNKIHYSHTTTRHISHMKSALFGYDYIELNTQQIIKAINENVKSKSELIANQI